MKKSTAFAALSCSALLLSCAGAPQTIPPVPAQEKVALVSFSLGKSITAKAELNEKKENDGGPGLLQKDSSYYADHQKALDSLWTKMQAGLPIALKVTLVPTSEIAGNAKYQELTRHVPNMVMGMDIAEGRDQLEPRGGLVYVSLKDTAKLRALAEALGVQRLLVVQNTAEYAGSMTLGGNGTAKMNLKTTVAFFQPGKGVYWKGFYSGNSKNTAVMLGGTISTSAFPSLLPETADPILVKIAEDAARGRGEAPAK